MKVYISGKVSGLPFEEVYKKFEAAESELSNHWNGKLTPVNPVKLVEQNDSYTWEDYMEKDIALLLRCQAIYMLTDWEDSKGARCEHALAKELGLRIVYQKK